MDSVSTGEWVPLTARQLSIWLELRAGGSGSSYQIGGYSRIARAIDAELLATTAEIIIFRYETLRLVIDAEEPRQRVSPLFNAPVDVIDLSRESNPEAAFFAFADTVIARPFELSPGPLFRVTLARLGDELWYSFLRAHHLIVDGLSIATLARVLAETYTALADDGNCDRIDSSTDLDFVAPDAAYCDSAGARRDFGLDSFVLLGGDPPEVGTVSARCPDAQGVVVPSDQADRHRSVGQFWGLDGPGT